MSISRWFVTGVVFSLPLTSLPGPMLIRSAAAQGYTQEGAALGGITGAIAGGIIGHQNDETPEGAILGGVVGAVAGGLLVLAVAQQLRSRQQYHNQMVYRQQQLAARAVTLGDVINMSRSGLSDTVIINHMQSNGVRHQLSTNDVITLHQNGVSERVISAMQQFGNQGPLVAAPPEVIVPPPHPAVVVRERYHVVPQYAPRVHVYHHPPHFHYRSGWHPRHRW